MRLRPYQADAEAAIMDAWEIHDIVMYVLATGGGKTVLFTEIIRKLLQKQKRSMMVAHRQELIYQAARTLMVQELDCGIIMASIPQQFEKPIQVCSVQTICRRETLPPADFYIFDEGHHAQPGNSWGKLIKQAVASGAKVLLVTATPYRLSGEGFEFLHDYKKTHLIVGPSLKQLQEEGWLVPLKYYAASIPDLSNIRLKAGDYDEDEAEEAMELAPIVESYLEHAKGKSGVCFCVNVQHSLKVVMEYRKAGIEAAHLDANTPKEDRAMILEWFKKGWIQVICNVGIITEGFDFPNMDFTQLACPTKSLSKYLQMVGRTTRPAIVVDKYDSADRRKYEIAKSRKPHGIILDNAGCWLDHNLPEFEHDWSFYFRGVKKMKKLADDMMEVWVFIAEDENGFRMRTTNPKEIEGLRLVEITTEQRKKYVNLACLKDFDKTYFTFQNLRSMQAPGYVAVGDFMKQCQKHDILMVDEVWAHIRQRTVVEVQDKLDRLEVNRSKNMSMWSDDMYAKEIKRIKRAQVSEEYLNKEKQKYEKKFHEQLREYKAKMVS